MFETLLNAIRADGDDTPRHFSITRKQHMQTLTHIHANWIQISQKRHSPLQITQINQTRLKLTILEIKVLII